MPAKPDAPGAQASMQYLPLAEVLRDGIWTEHGPHAVAGAFGTAPTLLAVVDEHGEDVRVVHEDWQARIAVWVPAARLRLTVTRPVALAGEIDGNPREEHAAVLLLPGILVTELARVEDRVKIDVADGEMNAAGWVDADVLGRIWVAEPFPDDPEPTHSVGEGVAIRLAPATDATIVATTQTWVTVVQLGTTRDWSEVRVVGSWMNVHGYVESYRLSEGGFGGLMGGMIGNPHPEWPEVPAGTCLVQKIGGEVVGVTLSELDDQEPVPGGAKIEIDLPWGSTEAIAEQTDDGTWRTCALSSGR